MEGKNDIMMKRLAVILLMVSMTVFGEEIEWNQVRDRNGVQVYNRRIPGIDFKEFMGEVEIDATLSTLLAVFTDVGRGSEWVENVDKMRDIERISPYENYTYSYSRAPWPVRDRDAVVHNIISQDRETGTVTIMQKGAPQKLEYADKAVRVERLNSSWVFTPMEGGGTHVRYQVLTDPGGRLPAWLINTVSVSQPYETLLGLKEMAGLDEYRDMRLDYIEE